MKRWLIGLAIILLFAGCSQQSDPTISTTEPAPTTPPPTLYLPESALEAETDGAVRVYPLGTDGCVGIRTLGDKLLMLALDTNGVLGMAVISGDDGTVEAAVVLHGVRAESVRTTSDRIACYNVTENSVLILDSALRITDRIYLPKGIEGDVWIDDTLSCAYYCAPEQIRAVDLNTEVPRLLHQHQCQQQSIYDIILGGTVLVCRVTDGEGTYFEFIDTTTGQTVGKDDAAWQIDAWNDRFFLRRNDGPVQENLFGSLNSTLQQLNITADELHGIPTIEAAVNVTDSENGLTLDCYDLATGLLCSQAVLPELHTVYNLTAAPESNYIWFIYEDSELCQDVLCRWDISLHGAEDTTVYTGLRYTADSPDEEGLARCRQWAEQLNQQYGISIVFDSTIKASQEYTLKPEYQISLLEQGLQALQTGLEALPEGFVKQLSRVSDAPLSIALVRSISDVGGHAPSDGTGLQYWHEGDACIALCITDTVLQDFYHQLFHLLEVYLYSESTQLDLWNDMNPKGFSYDHSYLTYEQHADSKYLQGKDRAFIDAYAMTYAKEDRARIFEYAMMAGNEDCFTSETMQEKLHQLSYCIRDAYGWKKSELSYPWEQYLEKSLAYTKKK